MHRPKLLICTDMDRTVIPNGTQPEHPDARAYFKKFCKQPGVFLAYVTGRHQALVQQAIAEYQLPEADFAITDVGTKIYTIRDNNWQELQNWEYEIDKPWHGYTHEQIKQLLCNIQELVPQETSKQNTHKLSYYVSLQVDIDNVLLRIEKILDPKSIDASLIWSIDEQTNTGLLDVLPKNATKLHAIEFLQQQLGLTLDDVIFAGDSGNDLPVLTSALHSVLVANASEDIRQTALQLAKSNGHADAIYLATPDTFNIGGNYSAGVLQGIWHYAPKFHSELLQIGLKP